MLMFRPPFNIDGQAFSPEIKQVDEHKSSTAVKHSIRLFQNGTMKRKIPGNKIFVVGPWVPEQIALENLQMEPNKEIHVFNYSAMARSVQLIDQELVAKVGLHGAWESWCLLRPWAYRADLWRYMILWSEGGVYLDSKMKLLAPLADWAGLLPDQEYLACCHDNGMTWSSKKRDWVPILWNGALSAPQGSHVVLEAIRLVIANVQNRTNTLVGEESALKGHIHADLAVTGPILLGYAAGLENLTVTEAVRVSCGFFGNSGVYIKPFQPNSAESGIVMKMDRSEHQRVRASGNIYGDLWTQKRIYCDKKILSSIPDPSCDIESLLL